MMATLAEIRQGLKERMDTISGLRTSAYMLRVPNPPHAMVKPLSRLPAADFDGNLPYVFQIWIYANEAGGSERAQQVLDQYLDLEGSHSIPAAIAGDPTLGGVVSWAREAGFEEYAMWAQEAGTGIFVSILKVEVMA